jgi:hypothetical protein
MVRLLPGLVYLTLTTQTISAASLPEVNNALDIPAEHAPRSVDVVSPDHTLERRKGGGGRGGGGGSSSGSSSGGGGGSRSSSSSTSGGQTRAGSGPARSFGGGGYYGGGAAVPYTAGSRTPKGLVAGALIAPFAILAIMPGLWLYSVYPYYYTNRYNFYNRTANRTANNNNNDRRDAEFVNLMIRQESNAGANESLPVICLCQENSVCGCDENENQQYITDLIGNGSYAALNKSLVTVSDVNGTRTLVLNGTLPPGTTAPGGVDDAAAALNVGKYAGYWAMGLVVLYGVFL